MSPVEFQIDLTGDSSLALPAEVVAQLPKTGRATVVLVVQDEDEIDTQWRQGAYEQFVKAGDAEDAVYDNLQ